MRPQMKVNLPHLDAQQNVFLARTLEHIDPAEYFELFAGLLGDQFIPPIDGVPPEVDVYSYSKITMHGRADVGAPGRGTNDHPVFSVSRKEVKTPIKEIPGSMQWTMRELEQAAKFNVPLDRWTTMAAMMGIGRKIDHMLAFGEPGAAITGLLNDTDVDTSTATTKTGGQIEWTASTPPAEMLADIALLLTEARNALNQASIQPNSAVPAIAEWTILMPSFHYGLAGSTPRASGTDTTVLEYALQNFKRLGLVAIEEWYQCSIASSVGGTSGVSGGPRMVCYARNPLLIGALVPEKWRQRNPQEDGDKIIVPCRGLCGGTVIRYNVAARYMDLHD